MLEILHEQVISIHLQYTSSVPANCGRNVSGVTIAGPYLYIEILVDFDGIAKEENVLHQTRKLPHVPQVLERLRRLGRHVWFGGCIELGLVRRALVARHGHGESWA